MHSNKEPIPRSGYLLSALDIIANMFRDTTHLDRYYGAAAFTAFLADEYADYLR